MTMIHLTTPFGRRGLTLAQVRAQTMTGETAPGRTAHKWQVFADVCEARAGLGVGDRTLAVLRALLSFHAETTLCADDRPIVYPSNAKLSLRAHGMAPATLRRHLGALVEAGLIIRRDSPNGKRYARRRGGAIAEAFGFDLAPLAARAGEFAEAAALARADALALRLARERVTLLRRDAAKTVAAGEGSGAPPPPGFPDWIAAAEALGAEDLSMPRRPGRAALEALAARLAEFAAAMARALISHVDRDILRGNESRNERHSKNSIPKAPESEPDFRKIRADGPGPADGPDPAAGEAPVSPSRPVGRWPVGAVLRACPAIADYATGAIRDRADLARAADLVRHVLGVSPGAWDEAVAALGEADAAVCVAAILQKGEAIRNPGGYLRRLTEKARANEFSIGPMLMALMRGAGGSQAA